MPGPLVTVSTTVMCAHAGTAKPTVPNPRVTVNGQPTVAMTSPYVIAGCPFTTASPQPCVTAQFTMAATRVQSNGQPLLLVDSQAITVPNGVPLILIPEQARAIAQ
ncbi:MAG TPA: hypothetical protein VN181_00550 [Thermoanaerobaculia bacterium]|nr:hypothetical protein [Thermoanaerobaculia bacterium]